MKLLFKSFNHIKKCVIIFKLKLHLLQEHSKRLGQSNKALSQLQSNLLELAEEQNDACRDYEQKKIDREQQQVQIDNLNGQIEVLY